NGIENTRLVVHNQHELWNACETLECYRISSCSDYPASPVVKMDDVLIETENNQTPNIVWTPLDKVTDCGHHAIVVNNSSSGGEVDLFFTIQAKVPRVGTSVGPALTVFSNLLYMAWKGAGSDKQIWWATFDGGSWTDQAIVKGASTSWRPALAV